MSLTLGPLESQRLNYPDLTEADVVFDVGGCLGEWSKEIGEKHGVTCHIFEPVPYLADNIRTYFATADRYIVHQAALSDTDGMTSIAVAGFHGDASGEWAQGEHIQVVMLDVERMVPDELAVLKLNCEGGEYAILERLIETGSIAKVRHIQVQFHDCFDDAPDMAGAIRDSLSETHTLAWTGGPWTFEGWDRR
jgi:FkbM family methyltransferase